MKSPDINSGAPYPPANTLSSGFVAVVGCPNAGKSSLVNLFVGQKVAIVSPKQQTTRNKILGILNEFGADGGLSYQIVFMDTPGIHAPKDRLGEYMMESVMSARKGADVVLIVIDAVKGLRPKDRELLGQCAMRGNLTGSGGRGGKTLVALNKTDLVKPGVIFPLLEEIGKYSGIEAIVPVSALKKQNTDKLLALIKNSLTDGVQYFDADNYTDVSERFLAAETIREKILYHLREEIPHGVQVMIEQYVEEKNLITISALIIVEKDSHKPIVIGKGGETLKKIGGKARLDMERQTGKKIMLSLFVKVSENWRDKPSLLNDFGFDKRNI